MGVPTTMPNRTSRRARRRRRRCRPTRSRSPRALLSPGVFFRAPSARRAASPRARRLRAPRRRLVPAVRPRRARGAVHAPGVRRALGRLARRAADAQPPEPPHEHQAQAGHVRGGGAFGAQKSARLDGPNGILGARFANERDWPLLVRLCVEDARSRVEARGAGADAFGPRRAMAHVNWYPDGTAGMGRHSDAEPSLVRGAPIFSYSFLSGGEESPPRVFDLYEKRGAPAARRSGRSRRCPWRTATRASWPARSRTRTSTACARRRPRRTPGTAGSTSPCGRSRGRRMKNDNRR